jgi:hypothetical protein
VASLTGRLVSVADPVELFEHPTPRAPVAATAMMPANVKYVCCIADLPLSQSWTMLRFCSNPDAFPPAEIRFRP